MDVSREKGEQEVCVRRSLAVFLCLVCDLLVCDDIDSQRDKGDLTSLRSLIGQEKEYSQQQLLHTKLEIASTPSDGMDFLQEQERLLLAFDCLKSTV